MWLLGAGSACATSLYILCSDIAIVFEELYECKAYDIKVFFSSQLKIIQEMIAFIFYFYHKVILTLKPLKFPIILHYDPDHNVIIIM